MSNEKKDGSWRENGGKNPSKLQRAEEYKLIS